MPNTLSRRSTLRLSLLCAALLFCHTVARSQNVKAPNDGAAQSRPTVQLVPRPKHLTQTETVFRLARDAHVALADSRSDEDRFAAQDFLDDLREVAGVSLKLGKGFGRKAILVGSLDLAPVQSALKRAGVEAPPGLNQEGYVLAVTADEIVVGGRSAAGTFYGLQTLKQLVRGDGADAFVPGVRITDWPTMRWRAFEDDINRGPVPTLDYIKRQVRNFSALKLNMLSWNVENAIAYRSHPLVGPEGGSLSPEEIREIVAYARRYHVEIVPFQQTFGHLHKVLKLEKYNELAETPYGDVLSPQQQGSYKLVADWYREISELFPSEFFHIGADETFELGQGQSQQEVKEKGIGAVYFEHLNRVREVLKPYNRKLMFWGDIALNHPDLLKDVPRDMIVMNWTYGPRDNYEKQIKPFKDAGLQQFVCPGVQNWNQIFPNEEAAIVNIRNFVRDGQAAGAAGVMNTSWDDDGESLFEMTWYGVALGAAASWADAPLDVQQFDRDYDWAFFRSEGDSFVKVIRDLGRVNAVIGAGQTDLLFWQEPFTAGFQTRARSLHDKTRQMRLMVEGAEETLLRERGRARRNRAMIPAMLFAARRFDHMGRRMEVMERFSSDYWGAYLNQGDRRRVGQLRRYSGAIYNSLREMAEELSALRGQYRERWLAENRPYWLDSILARYDLAINQWLSKSRTLEEALRRYEINSTLPSPEEFGLGSKPDKP